ncbi:DNA-binding transcription repressor [Scheffersomyces spartinae]|uniref:DNA-binding transcription repressor n=1 Tax=Scheffersomyces spartinae TaxID=45513 RepID=A0A9P7V9K7_9ASCO|nr:DNA-binding transcription repressor [Scheffersomyces spartinae]KAG7193931.1 DNA-binding transcription repressor [Scheffersomyces spartinae]
MSLLLSKMINNQLDSFERGHLRSRSFNELLNQYKSHIHSPNRAASDSKMILGESNRHQQHQQSSPSDLSRIDSSLNASPSFMSTGDISSANTTADVSFISSNKRSFLESDNDTLGSNLDDSPTIKRSRTAPLLPAPLSPPARGRVKNNILRLHSPGSLRSRSLSPHKKFFEEGLLPAATHMLLLHSGTTSAQSMHIESTTSQPNDNLKKTVKLPSLSAVLGDVNSIIPSSTTTSTSKTEVPIAAASISTAPVSAAVELEHQQQSSDSTASAKKHITPTVSLDYFDTYKPNDENWRYELLDSINKGSKHFNLNQYNYLNKSSKPSFDSKISSKILKPTLPSLHANIERKINFPFESNYTYLNKTYLTDVAKYPEYLELAQSLVQLSQPQTIREQSTQTQEAQHPQQQQQATTTATVPDSLSSPTLPSVSSNIMPVAPPITSTIPPFSQLSPQMPSPNNNDRNASYSSIICAPGSMSLFNNQSLARLPSFILRAATTSIPIDESIREASSTAIQQPMAPMVVAPTATTQGLAPPPSMQHLPHQTLPSLPTITPRSTTTATSISMSGSNNSSTRFVPVSPPPSSSTLKKAKEALMRSPPKHHHHPRVCILCGSEQSPCWRPSWSLKEGQLCNSCGLRYKKTLARCLNDDCRKIPAKGEWSLMQSKGKTMFEDGIEGYGCLECGWRVEVKK